MSEIAVAYRRDMRARRVIEDAKRALDVLLGDDYAAACLGHHVAGDTSVLRDSLAREAARLVRVWD